MMTSPWITPPTGNNIPVWAPNTLYPIRFVVQYNDQLYRANATFTSGTTFNPGNWTQLTAVPISTYVRSFFGRTGDITLQAGDITGPLLPSSVMQAQYATAPSIGVPWVLNVRDPQWSGGARGDGYHDDTAAIQAAINQATLNSGGGGTVVYLPAGTYLISAALLIYFGVHLVGAGRGGTSLKARSTGNATTDLAQFTNGTRSTFPAMIKWNGGDVWAHHVIVTELEFNVNGIPGLSGSWFQSTGETSMFHNLGCSNTVAVTRQVTDAQLTAGSTTVTFTASTVTEDDVNAVITMGAGVATPAAPTIALAAGGTMATSSTQVAVRYQTNNGEGPVSLTNSLTPTTGNQSIVVTSPAASPGATGYVVYMGNPLIRQSGVVAIGTNYTQSAPITTGKTPNPYDKIDRIGWAVNSFAATATSMIMRNPAVASLSNVTMTIARPTDAFVFDGGGVAGRIGTLNGTVNTGALLRIKNGGGTFEIDELSGDDNIGGILRVSGVNQGGDPAFIHVKQIKSETDPQYNTNTGWTMDPVVLFDRCSQIGGKFDGGSIIGNSYSRDVVRLDNSIGNWDYYGATNLTPFVGGPSLELGGLEGQNWYNPAYTNIVHDTTTTEAIPVSGSGASYNADPAYPTIFWNRHVRLGGGADVPDLMPSNQVLCLAHNTPLKYNNATWNWTTYSGFWGLVAYNLSNAQNDGFGWYVPLLKGTYNFLFWTSTGPAAAIVTYDVSLDGGNTWQTIGTQDQYAAANGIATPTYQGISITKSAKAILRMRSLTRNASSTGWSFAIAGVSITRISIP